MLDLGVPARDKNGNVPRFEGQEITINGVKLILSPWNIRTAKMGCDLRRVLRDANLGKIDADSEEVLAAQVRLLAITINMNYPQVTEDTLLDELRVTDMRKLSQKILELNTTDDEELGEATAAKTAATLPLNGTISPSSSVESSTGPGV